MRAVCVVACVIATAVASEAQAGPGKSPAEKSRRESGGGGDRTRDTGGGRERSRHESREQDATYARAAVTSTAADVRAIAEGERSPALALYAQAGVSQISAGAVDVPLEAAAALTVSVPIPIGAFVLEPAAVLVLAPIPYEAGATNAALAGTALLTGVFVQARGGYCLTQAWSVHLEAGAGLAWLSGLSTANNFTASGAPPTTAIELFGGRAAVSVEANVGSPRFAFVLTPLALTLFKRSDQLRADVGALRRLEALAGVRYHF